MLTIIMENGCLENSRVNGGSTCMATTPAARETKAEHMGDVRS